MTKKPNLKKLPKLNKLITKEHLSLNILLAVIVFFWILFSLMIAGFVAGILMYMDILEVNVEELPSMFTILQFLIGSSLILSILLAIPLTKIPLMPINKVINCINLLASGNYKVNLIFGWPITNMRPFSDVARSFNKLSQELQNTEMLRGDFVNNFSHEFKTPIVSIAGFAKLLRKNNLSEAQRLEYLDIIEEEALRLSYMATNALSLTKVENQSILTEVSAFNLSEQLRSCILLLERDWAKKRIELDLRFDEYQIEGNEELLKQVWINLLDNAIKFTEDGGQITVDISDDIPDFLSVSVTNYGIEIPVEKQGRLFQKFYQADESHGSSGNGIGLAVVKQIVNLHEGEVQVQSGKGQTTFTVLLPSKQI